MITHGKKVNRNKIKHKRRGIFIRGGIGFPKKKKRKKFSLTRERAL